MKKPTTTNNRVDTYKAAYERTQKKLRAKAAADAKKACDNESAESCNNCVETGFGLCNAKKIVAPLTIAAYNKAVFDAMPVGIATDELHFGVFADVKPVTKLTGPVATVEKTDSGKKAEEKKAKKADKAIETATEYLKLRGITHGEKVKNNAELLSTLKMGLIVVYIGKSQDLTDTIYNQAWRVTEPLPTQLLFQWLHNGHTDAKDSARIWPLASLECNKMDFNGDVRKSEPKWRNVVVFKA